MRTVGISTLFGLCIATGCTSGEAGHPPVLDANDTRGIGCVGNVTVAGSFVQGAARPPENPTGCWPIGMWTFVATLVPGSDTCTPPTMPLPQYQFMGTTTTDPDTGDYLEMFAYVPQPNDPTVNSSVKANEGGTGLCEGDLSLYDVTGTQVWSLKPELNADNSITGDGQFRVYATDQWGM